MSLLRRPTHRRRRAFTLVELMVAAVIGALVTAGLFLLLTAMARSNRTMHGQALLRDRAITILTEIENAVRDTNRGQVQLIDANGGNTGQHLRLRRTDPATGNHYFTDIYSATGTVPEDNTLTALVLDEDIASTADPLRILGIWSQNVNYEPYIETFRFRLPRDINDGQNKVLSSAIIVEMQLSDGGRSFLWRQNEPLELTVHRLINGRAPDIN